MIRHDEPWVQIASLDEQNQIHFSDDFLEIMGELGWEAKAAFVQIQFQPSGFQEFLRRHAVHIQVTHLAAVDPAQGRAVPAKRVYRMGIARFIHRSGENTPGSFCLFQKRKRRPAQLIIETGDVVR